MMKGIGKESKQNSTNQALSLFSSTVKFVVFTVLPGLLMGGIGLVLLQDILIHPGLRVRSSLSQPPHGVVESLIQTEDAEQIVLWKLPVSGDKAFGLVFHGNGGPLASFFSLQQWFRHLGMTSYAFDYRGYGNSSGWPSEAGFYLDSRAVWKHISEETPHASDKGVLLGTSLGTGFASELARRIKPQALILLSPYLSIPEVVRDRGLLAALAPLLWYDVPTSRYLQELPEETCLIIAHGEQDTIIRYRHFEELKQQLLGRPNTWFIAKAGVGHDVFGAARLELESALAECMSRGRSAQSSE